MKVYFSYGYTILYIQKQNQKKLIAELFLEHFVLVGGVLNSLYANWENGDTLAALGVAGQYYNCADYTGKRLVAVWPLGFSFSTKSFYSGSNTLDE